MRDIPMRPASRWMLAGEKEWRGARQWQLSQVGSLLATPQRALSCRLQFIAIPSEWGSHLVLLSLTGSWISGLPAWPQTPRPSDISRGHEAPHSLSYGVLE